MRAPEWKRLWPLPLIIVIYLLVYWHFRPIAGSEPDQYYHLSMARAVAENGWIRRVPQVEDLRWGERYPNLHLLFSLINGTFYRVGGERATMALVPVFAVALLSLVYAFARRRGLSPLMIFLVALPLLLTPDFANRIVTLRPHLLAMVFFCLFVIGLAENRPRWALAGGLLFPLAYHAVYIPWAILGAATVVGITLRPGWKKTLCFGAAGLILGSVAMPDAWENFKLTLSAPRIGAGGAGFEIANHAMEGSGLSGFLFLARYGFFLVVVAIATPLFLAIATTRRIKVSNPRLLFLWLIAAGSWAMVPVSQQALEYAVPAAVLLLSALLGSLPQIKTQTLTAGLAAGLALLLGPTAFPFYSNAAEPMVDARMRKEAVASLPESATGKKVFNAEWYISPFLLYFRPDLRFVDIGDPAGLWLAAPYLHADREKLLAGNDGDVYRTIHEDFGSDFVLTENAVLVSRLETHPAFRRLYPTSFPDPWPRSLLFLYEVAPKPHAGFVSEYALGPSFSLPRQAVGPTKPPPDFSDGKIEARYVDLRQKNAESRNLAGWEDNQLSCQWLRPETDAMEGATLVGVGGGPEIYLWLNEIPLGRVAGATSASSLHHLMRLPRRLRIEDALTALVCTPKNEPFYGLTLSLWTEKRIDEICEWKNSFPRIRNKTCLAPILTKR